MKVESAEPDDLAPILELLRASSLPVAGVETHLQDFLVARDDASRVVGCIGAELYGDVGLLRSLAVEDDARGSGVGRRLVEALLERSRERELDALFLLTTTAERYFPRFGFSVVPRDRVDERLQASEELRGACPETAVAMRLVLREPRS